MAKHHKFASNVDLAGRKFGELTVLRRAYEPDQRIQRWECQCSCGKLTRVRYTRLLSGKTKSCGHLRHAEKTYEKAAETREKNQSGIKMTRRAIDSSESGATKRSSTGIRGVSLRHTKGGLRYRSSITIRGRRRYLGEFRSKRQARQARLDAEEEELKKLEG